MTSCSETSPDAVYCPSNCLMDGAAAFTIYWTASKEQYKLWSSSIFIHHYFVFSKVLLQVIYSWLNLVDLTKENEKAQTSHTVFVIGLPAPVSPNLKLHSMEVMPDFYSEESVRWGSTIGRIVQYFIGISKNCESNVTRFALSPDDLWKGIWYQITVLYKLQRFAGLKLYTADVCLVLCCLCSVWHDSVITRIDFCIISASCLQNTELSHYIFFLFLLNYLEWMKSAFLLLLCQSHNS